VYSSSYFFFKISVIINNNKLTFSSKKSLTVSRKSHNPIDTLFILSLSLPLALQWVWISCKTHAYMYAVGPLLHVHNVNWIKKQQQLYSLLTMTIMFSCDVLMHFLKSSLTKEPPKFLSSSGIRGGIFISV